MAHNSLPVQNGSQRPCGVASVHIHIRPHHAVLIQLGRVTAQILIMVLCDDFQARVYIPVGSRAVRDQRPVITVRSGRLPAHVALAFAVFVAHIRNLYLAAFDLFVNGVVFWDQTALQPAVVDLGVGVVPGARGPQEAAVFLAHAVRLQALRQLRVLRVRDGVVAVVEFGRLEVVADGRVEVRGEVRLAAHVLGVVQAGVHDDGVRAGGVLLFRAAVSRVPAIRLKRNVL